MSRSYPIGSLLLLAKSQELKLSSRHIEAEIAQDCLDKLENTIQKNEVDEEYYILDGQQRTTSIARVFLNAHPEKCYYFDLKKMLKPDQEEGISQISKKRDSWITEGTSWIIAQSRGSSSPDRKNNNRLLRADIVLDQEKTDIFVGEYITYSKDFPKHQQDRTAGPRAAAQIRGIFETIRNYKVPIVVVESDSGIESICRIFETINSTGTKLTTFDLAVARFYPQPDLRKLWEDTQKQYPILKDFGVDGERVLQVLYLVTATRNEKYRDIEPTRSNLMSLTTELINEEWESSSGSLAKMYEFAKAQGARPETLPRHSLLVSLAAVRSLIFCEQLADPWHDRENHDFIRRWYFSKVMQASRAQASNYQVSQDFKVLLEYIRTGKRPEIPTVSLDVKKILMLKPSDVRYKSLQNIFTITLRQDLLSGNSIKDESQLHDHHIFPKNAGKKQKYDLNKTMLDSICNRVPMLASSNRSLGEGYPQVYLQEIAGRALKENMLGDLKRRMCDCLIPGDPGDSQWADSFSPNRFEEFCQKRAELIVARVSEIVGCPLQNISRSSDDEVEDEED